MATKSIEFESAQHVQVEFELASTAQRVLAALLDFVLLFIYTVIFVLVFQIEPPWSGAANLNSFVWLLFIKIPWVLYHPVLEFWAQGQTLGKYIMGIRVVTQAGERPGLREVFTRWVFRGDFIWISSMGMWLFWFLIGIFGIFFSAISPFNQRIGDAMAGMLVIRNKSSIQYRFNDVLNIKKAENHEVTYPQVIGKFTDEDMMLIKSTIVRVKRYPNEQNKAFAVQLANQTAELMGLSEVPEKKFQFLQTVLQDYVVLTR